MRSALYARFSSELQDERSIIDQIALARKYAETRGLAVAEVYQDAAISGASTLNRPGLQKLVSDAARSKFEVVVTESLDRLSRSQADIAALYERLTFLGVRIETLADGAVSEIHVGLKGTMSALFLKDLAQKTRRGQIVGSRKVEFLAARVTATISSKMVRIGDSVRSTSSRQASSVGSLLSMRTARGLSRSWPI